MEKGVEMQLTNPLKVQVKNPLEESKFPEWVDYNFKLINTICSIGISVALMTLVFFIFST